MWQGSLDQSVDQLTTFLENIVRLINLQEIYFIYISEYACSVAQLCMTLCDPMDYIACKVPLSMGFSTQEYWKGLPFPTPGVLPDPEVEPASPQPFALQEDSLPMSHLESPYFISMVQ